MTNAKHTPRKWYKANSGSHQGLICDEETGENIAISYKVEHADLIAAAPELLEACKKAMEFFVSERDFDDIKIPLEQAILKAEGK